MTVFGVMRATDFQKMPIGKSTLSTGLSIWFSTFSKDPILLVDGETHTRDELKVCPTQRVTLADTIQQKKHWREAVYQCALTLDGKVEADLELNKYRYPNLSVLPTGAFLQRPAKTSPYEHLKRASRDFGRTLADIKKRYKHIIIDLPKSVNYEHLILTAASDKLVYACEVNNGSVSATAKTCKSLRLLTGVAPAGIVFCRVPPGANVNIWAEKASKIAPVLGIVPVDSSIEKSSNRRLPVVAAYPESPASLEIKAIAQKLWGVKEVAGAEVWTRVHRAVNIVARRAELMKKRGLELARPFRREFMRLIKPLAKTRFKRTPEVERPHPIKRQKVDGMGEIIVPAPPTQEEVLKDAEARIRKNVEKGKRGIV